MPRPCVEESKEEQFSYEQDVSKDLVEVVKQGVHDTDRVTCSIQQRVQPTEEQALSKALEGMVKPGVQDDWVTCGIQQRVQPTEEQAVSKALEGVVKQRVQKDRVTFSIQQCVQSTEEQAVSEDLVEVVKQRVQEEVTCENQHCVQPIDEQAVSKALVEVMNQGVQEDRVTCGIQQCVQLIASCPDDVMLCLLEKLSASQDAAIKVPLVLLRAYCQENSINLIHVLGESKMAQLMAMTGCYAGGQASARSPGVVVDIATKTKMSMPVQEVEEEDHSVGCIMIKYPKHTMSAEDHTVVKYIKEKEKNYTDPTISIPDVATQPASVNQTMGTGFKLKKQKMKMPIQASY